MKKIIILLLLTISLTGCSLDITKNKLNNDQKENNDLLNNSKEENFKKEDLDDNQLIVANSSTNKKELKRFYPDAGLATSNSEAIETVIKDSEKSFNITSELIAKMYLIDKYNPGVCFGMPNPVPQSAIDSLINSNKNLSDFIKNRYKLSSDLELYNKLKQLQNIQLTFIASSKYNFQFMDGQCCIMTFYQGIIEVNGEKAYEIIEKEETKNNPC